ncbi:jg26800 [Pararge aegeria aegeria]|uniref:Jg26800 protein n=1 Tax=Pararge aegeria aegeria TaxID=348720 RepID=A0A8S4SK24_9NEOP|nr:jg26800 [Pararge aegeria aegeria]
MSTICNSTLGTAVGAGAWGVNKGGRSVESVRDRRRESRSKARDTELAGGGSARGLRRPGGVRTAPAPRRSLPARHARSSRPSTCPPCSLG